MRQRITRMEAFRIAELLRKVCHKDAATGLAVYDRDWDDNRVAAYFRHDIPHLHRQHIGKLRSELIGLTHPQKGYNKKAEGAVKEISMAAAIEIREAITDLNERLSSLERSLGVVPPKKAEEPPHTPQGMRWFGGRSK